MELQSRARGLSAVVLSINNDSFIQFITRVICATSSGSFLESLELFLVHSSCILGGGGGDISAEVDSSWPHWARIVPSALTPCCICITDIAALGLGDECGIHYSLASCKEKTAKPRKTKGADTFRRTPDLSKEHFGHGS